MTTQQGAARPRPATSLDVARLAGVSRATVSHVLNDQVDRFSEETVDRVRRAAAELGYVRSAVGRALVLGRSDFVVLAVPHTTFGNLQDIVDVVTADLEGLGFTVIVHFSGAEETSTPRRLQHLVEALRPAGLLHLGGLSPQSLRELERNGCPVIPSSTAVAKEDIEQRDGNVAIGRIQVEHLLARGHTRIGYAFRSDQRSDPWGTSRASGAADVCAAHGLPAPVHLAVPLEPVGAQRVLRDLLARAEPPMALACYNDDVALAVVFAALALGLAVPGGLAAIGVERGDVGQLVTPRLSTVAPDVSRSLSWIRSSIAHTYGGPHLPAPLARGFFSIVQGETT